VRRHCRWQQDRRDSGAVQRRNRHRKLKHSSRRRRHAQWLFFFFFFRIALFLNVDSATFLSRSIEVYNSNTCGGTLPSHVCIPYVCTNSEHLQLGILLVLVFPRCADTHWGNVCEKASHPWFAFNFSRIIDISLVLDAPRVVSQEWQTHKKKKEGRERERERERE
jgi:hypothetical protein